MTASRFARPDVLANLPAEGHAVVQASAGTGKTYTLEALVVELVLVRGLPVEELLVVTFTERAASELKDRVRARLRDLAEGRAQRSPDGRPDAPCWTVGEEERRRLRRALSSFEAASVSTIHAFCRRVLVEHAFLGGRLLAQEDAAEEGLLRRIVAELSRGPLSTDASLRPWLEAWLAGGKRDRAESGLDALASLLHQVRRALGGSGELFPRFDPERLAALVAGFPSYEGDEAALKAELRAEDVNAQTVRSVAPALLSLLSRLQWHGDRRAAAELPPALLADPDVRADVTTVLKGTFATAELTGSLASLRDACLELRRLLVPLEAAVASVVSPLTEERLAAVKVEEGLLDFTDMLAHVDEALRSPRGASLRAALRRRYRAALIDEFQDTDDRQWAIFRELFLDASEGHSLFLVGDPKQAIYRFRGADVPTYLAAREEVAPESRGRRLTLSTSYRSSADLVAALNLLGRDDAPARLMTNDIPYGEPLVCGRPGLSLVDAEGAPAPPVLLLEAPAGAGNAAAVTRLLARAVAREVRRVLGGSLLFGERGAEALLGASDLFVLTRTRRESEAVAEELEAEGVRASLGKHGGLFGSDEAEDARTLLLALDDPDDPRRRARLLLTPFFGLDLDGLASLGGLPGDAPLLAPLRAWRRDADARDWAALLPRVLDESGLTRRLLFLSGGSRALGRFEQLLGLLTDEGVRRRASAGELAAWLLERRRDAGVAGDDDVERPAAAEGAVGVLTMHAAKGLEAAVVFVLGGLTTPRDSLVRAVHLGERRLAVVGRTDDPGVLLALDREEEAEERRLLYVAATRARARLVLPYLAPGNGPSRAGGIDGMYRHLNARLGEIVPSLGGTPEERLFRVEAADASPAGSPAAGRAAGEWVPPPQPPLPDAETEREAASRLAAGRSGLVLTSFSRLKAAARRDAPDRFEADVSRDVPRAPLAAGDLPPGIPTGLLLHALLEEADLSSVAASAGADAWAALPAVSARGAALLSGHGLPAPHLPRALALVHAALTTPFALGGGRSLPPLCRTTRVVREMEFLFPLPPRGGDERGFVQGFVDAVVEADGRFYLLDWKSDLLDSWEPEALAAHVEAHYALQARLYSAAVVRLLDLAVPGRGDDLFGGHVYVFLRALDTHGPQAAVAGRVSREARGALDADLERLLDAASREEDG